MDACATGEATPTQSSSVRRRIFFDIEANPEFNYVRGINFKYEVVALILLSYGLAYPANASAPVAAAAPAFAATSPQPLRNIWPGRHLVYLQILGHRHKKRASSNVADLDIPANEWASGIQSSNSADSKKVVPNQFQCIVMLCTRQRSYIHYWILEQLDSASNSTTSGW